MDRSPHIDGPNAGGLSGTFYRYRRFDDPANSKKQRAIERERLKRMFAERVVWFAKPSTLNDPFDCKPVLGWSTSMRKNREHIEAIWKDLYKSRYGALPKDRNEVSKRVSAVMAEMRTQQQRNEQFVKALDKSTGLVCLSRKWNITQQWTYYGRNHTGLCIGLDVRQGQPAAFPIKYTNERPQLDLIRLLVDDTYKKHDLHHASLLVKADSWKHEAEVRIIRASHGNHPLPDNIFKSVTFGMAASDEDIDWTLGICKEAGLNILFYRCVLDGKTFSIKRKLLP